MKKLNKYQIAYLADVPLAGIVSFLLVFFKVISFPVGLLLFVSIVVISDIAIDFLKERGAYDVYFYARQVLKGAFIGFLAVGTFTSSAFLTCVALAGMLVSAIFLSCVNKHGKGGDVQETWRKLSERLAGLDREEQKAILEESLRYKLDNDELNGSLQLDKPICEQDGKAVTYAECVGDTGKNAIGAYIDRVVDNKSDDKDSEVQ